MRGLRGEIMSTEDYEFVSVMLLGEAAKEMVPPTMLQELSLLTSAVNVARGTGVEPPITMAEMFLRASSAGVDVLLNEYTKTRLKHVTRAAREAFSKFP